MKCFVSVVVPFYNEKDNVAILAKQIEASFSVLPDHEYECVFVNDGSTDGTREQIENIKANDEKIQVLHFTSNCGQSAALIAGMRHSKGEYILTLDGDLQNDPADFPRILELLDEYDFVCGYRADRNDNWLRRFSSKMANSVRNAVLRDGISDIGCGTKGFRRCCVEHLLYFDGVHRFFPVILQRAGLTMTECEVKHHPRKYGKSKYGVQNRLWRGIYDLLGMRWLMKRYIKYKIEGE